jgi:hypothetical protein
MMSIAQLPGAATSTTPIEFTRRYFDDDDRLGSCVLLPVDMQRAFDGPPWPRRWNDRVDENGIALLKQWRKAGRPIVHVRHDLDRRRILARTRQ